MSRVRIVVPIYNAEKFVKELLDSIVTQTFKDWECYLINDGSTDNSEKIIQPYLADERFVYIKQENQGASVARNKGIEGCSTEYIYFCDADDILRPLLLEKSIEALDESGLDLVQFGHDATIEGGEMIRKHFLLKGVHDEVDTDWLCVPWNVLTRTSIITNNNLRFDKELKKMGEDTLFVLQCLYYAKESKYITIRNVLYNHRYLNLNSLSNAKTGDDVLKFASKIREFIKDKDPNNSAIKELKSKYDFCSHGAWW